jgi:2-oxoglutarate dehydrogenase E2 component (dihydrolipoamide succinyltransferase)
MPNEIRVPDLGDLVTSATLGRWLKKVGENVAADEVVAEIDTNKAAVEYPRLSPASSPKSKFMKTRR